MTCFVSSWM